MKKTVLMLACALLSLGSKAQIVSIVDASDVTAGDSVDNVKYEIVYDLNAMVPSKNDTTSFSERMLLQVGVHVSAFFSYVKYQVDSLVRAQAARGENINISTSARVSWQLYKNIPVRGQSVYLDRIANDNFRVEEKMDIPEWEVVPDSVCELLGYKCRMAQAKFKGRQWYAWYAVDVPIDNGPWKLQGLPGLILKAYDSNREFTFKAVGMTNVGGARNIYYKGKGYQQIDRRGLNKIYKRFYADAIGYALMTYPQSSTSSIRITDGEGNVLKHSKPQPYNLLEW